MGYLKLLRDSAKERQSIVCFGLDPIIESMPDSLMQPREERIVYYFTQIIDAALAEKQSLAALKPNYAYFAQYGFDGLRALQRLIQQYKGKLPIILDAKRGDIGRSSEAYAREVFDFWNADAVTVSPYMGYDSVAPFLERCGNAGKGAYILCRTSNSGSEDLQMKLTEDSKPLYLHVAKKLEKWYVPGMGAVVGAKEPEELELVMWDFYDSHKEIPLLVPGVGAQGTSASMVARTLRTVWLDAFPIHRINSSSAIAYAYRKKGTADFVGAALAEIQKLNREIGDV
ncbi:Orotidine 5'-phosphate decarboxylase [uncultured archaeon]|nr:Orotidine 5'-phosphate decarboxylase [uncultured archaeon]